MKMSVALCTVMALTTTQLPAEPGHVFPPLKPEEILKIQSSIPEALAKPAKPRKLLLFYRTEGFVHSSIPYCNEAIKDIGDKTGAYSTDLSDDMKVMTTDNLKQYDGILFNSTTGLKFEDPAARQALLDFVKSGKGVIGIHAATDNFNTWPEGQELLGGHFQGHPWTSHDVEAVKLDDPKSPMNAAFGGGFWINDEIYQMAPPFDRAKVRVLLSLDMSKPQNARDPKKIKRTDNDFPISWIKTVDGGGRVFYCSLGHNPSIFWCKPVLQHYLDGIQFALGDLQFDTVPSAKIEPALLPLPAPDLITLLNPLPQGQKLPAPWTAASATITPTPTVLPTATVSPAPSPAASATASPSPMVTNAPAPQHLLITSPPDVTPPPQSQIANAMALNPSGFVSDGAHPTNPQMVAQAGMPLPSSRSASDTLGDASFDVAPLKIYDYGLDRSKVAALIEEIRTQGDGKHEQIESALIPLLSDASVPTGGKDYTCRLLGQIGSDKAVPALSALLPDSALSHMAAYALFQIGSPTAKDTLRKSVDQIPAELQPAVLGSLARLKDSDALPALTKLAGSNSVGVSNAAIDALSSLGTVDALNQLNSVKVPDARQNEVDWACIEAAKRVLTTSADQKELVSKSLEQIINQSQNPSTQGAAVSVLVEADPEAGFSAISAMLKSPNLRSGIIAVKLVPRLHDKQADEMVQLFPTLDPVVQAAIVNVIAPTGSAMVEPVLKTALVSKTPAVHFAAISGLGIANLPDSSTLLMPLLSGSPDESAAACAALSQLKNLDPLSGNGVDFAKSSDATKVALINLIALREDPKMKDQVFSAANDPNPIVGNAAFRAIAVLAGPEDLDKLLALIPNAKNDDQRRNLNRAVSRAANLAPDKAKTEDDLISALKTAPLATRQPLVLALTSIGSDKATETLTDLLKDPSIDNRKDMIRILSQGRNPIGDKLLLFAVKNGSEDSEKILAIRGYLDSVGNQKLSMDNRLADLKQAWDLTIRQEEKDAILATLKKLHGDAPKKLYTELSPVPSPTPTLMPIPTSTPSPTQTKPATAAPSPTPAATPIQLNSAK